MPLDLEKIDLGGFGISKEEDTGLTEQLRSNMDEALKVNPDQRARVSNLSKQSGIPEFAVESDPAEVEHNLKLDQIDFDSMSKRNPNTAKFLVDFNNSVIAQDDIDIMQSIEDGLNATGEYFREAKKSFEKGQLMVESSELGLSGMYSSLGRGEPLTEAQVTRLKEIEDITKQRGEEYGFLPGAPITAAEQLPILYEILSSGAIYAGGAGAGGALVGAGVGSLAGGVGAVPGAIAGAIPGAKIGGRIGVAKAAFDLEAGLAYNEFSVLKDEKGNLLDPQVAAGAAAVVGGINAGLEFISLAALGRTVTPAIQAVIKTKVRRSLATESGRQMLMRLMKDYGFAVATEATTETAQEFTNVVGAELAKYIDKDSFTEQDVSSALDNIFSGETAERVLEAGEKGAQAALIFAGAGTSVSAIAESRRKETLSKDEQQRIDALNANFEESKLRERDSESFRQFVNEADGDNNTQVFIDGAQATLYLQTKTAEEIQADPALTLLAERAQEAAAFGGDVQVSVADFATDIAGTPHYEQLRETMTLSGETASPFRQEQVKQETDNYVKALMAEAQLSTNEYVEAQEIYTRVRDQLIDSGQVNAQNASIMAQIVPAWATAQARRAGKTVQQVYQEAGLSIVGPLTGEKARLAEEEQFAEGIAAASGFTPTKDPAEFVQAITEAKGSRDTGAFVYQYPEEDYKGMQLFTGEDGKVGFAVKEDGDIVSVFKHADSETKGALDKVIPLAIEMGGTKLDAFEGFLTEQYAKFGFQEVRREPWSDENAPPNWDYEKFGTPDVVYMELPAEAAKDGTAFREFFAGVTEGTVGLSDTAEDYAPVVTVVADQIAIEGSDLNVYDKEYMSHKGKFDDHIALSIPGYRDFQYAIGDALVKTFESGTMLDIGASEGTQAKTITSLSGGKVETVSLDPNLSMAKSFETISRVEGATYSMTALGVTKEDTGVAWTEEDGTVIEYFDEKGQQFDIVQESMVFQFIDNNRDEQIARVAELTKDDGIAVIQEKVHTSDWQANEDKKNKEYKSKFFSAESLDAKSAEVLEGMNKNMVTQKSLEDTLLDKFDFVEQIWDAGNFKGYAASNSAEKLKEFTGNLVDTRSEFDTRTGAFAQPIGKEDRRVERATGVQVEGERRVTPTERRKSGSKARAMYDALTRDELIDQLLKHELTGIKGRKAFVVDVQDAKAVASIDADSLKWINDNLSPDHGDALLEAVADALDEQTEGAYHISGDEFYVLGETEAEVKAIVDSVVETLSNVSITATKPDGTTVTLVGLNITHGIGASKSVADQKLKKEKVTREEAGLRAARGQQPFGAVVRTAEGVEVARDLQERLAQSIEIPTALGAFGKWFGKSKIVDEKGEPLVVYHGTDADIDAFDPEKVGLIFGVDEKGFFFTANVSHEVVRTGKDTVKVYEDPYSAGAYAKHAGETPNVIPVYLSIQNPLTVEDLIYNYQLDPKDPFDGAHPQDFLDGNKAGILSDAKLAGNDGIALEWEGDNVFVAFKPTQIKSAIGNIGTYDPADPSIVRQENRGYYEPANSIIRLTEAANLSTFLHEFAHFMYEKEVDANTEMLQSINGWYRRNAESVAKEAMSYDPGVTILTGHVEQFLDTGTVAEPNYDAETNKRTTDAIRRSVHEQFARGFETYLMEGKAPSVELRNAFRAFARWMTQIYKAIRGELSVDLDAEMRQVFDRLLATDEQIQAAEGRAQVQPMFTDAAMAGMTEEEFASYLKQQEKVKDVQTETLRDKIMKQLTRTTKKWWKEEKQDLIDEEIASLQKEKVYAARERLKSGDFKLDHATVKEMAGETKTDKIGRTSVVVPPALIGLTVKGKLGVHPDEAAGFLGYGSGAEMMKALVDAPTIKDKAEVNAEARMVETHGDILNDGTIEREADEAIQSEERGKLILKELKALAKNTNAPTINRAAVKDLAETNIGKLSFREIHPAKYRRAEVRAANEAGRMLAEGNRESAASAKMRQVMNYYLGMEATEAKNETMKIVDRMARYNKKKVREEIMKAENGYWDQLSRILSRFEFRKSATLKEIESLNLWVKERMESDGDGLVLSNVVLDESYVTHWKNIPHADLQGINDSVKNIEHVARYANKIKLQQEEIDFKKLKSQWVEHIKVQDERFPTKESRSRIDDSRDATTMEHIRKWASQLTKIPFLASWLDGGERAGMSHDILVQPFTDALDAKIKMVDEIATPVLEAINNRSKADQKRHNTKIWIPEIDDHMMGHQVLAVALNIGNHGNLKKMLLGEGWADPEVETDIAFDNPQLQAVLQHMTESDWRLVQTIWDQMELLYPQLAEVHRRTTGLTPPKVVPTEIVIPAKVDRPEIKVRGGYYPVKYSPVRSHKAEKNAEKREAETESMFNNTASIQSSVNAGATNERTGFYDRIHLSMEVIPDHFNETIHYITHHDAVRQTNRLIQAPDIASAVTGVLGESEFKQLKPWLNDIAKDGRQQPVKTYIDTAFQRLRFGTTLGIMGFKASTGIMQLFGILTTAAELGTGATMKGIYTTVGRSWYMKAVRNTLGSRDDMQTAWEFAVERSKVMSHRALTMDREIRSAMDRLRGKRGLFAAAQETSMKHIALIQTYMVDLPTWHAAYQKELSESGDEARAIKRADWSVENLQGSGATKDMATIMRNQGKIHTTFTMFMTFFSSLGNLGRDTIKGRRTGIYSPTSVAAKLMFLYTLPVFFEMLMRGELDEPDDEDERLSKFVTATALYPLTSIPFVRDVASGLIGDYGYNSSPVASMLEKGIQGSKQIMERAFTDEEVTKSAIKNTSKVVAAAAGIPGINQLWATGEHLYDVLEDGEDLTGRELIFGPDR